jgi:hypothetical protein
MFCCPELRIFTLRNAIATTAIKNEVIPLYDEIGGSQKVAILDPLVDIEYLAA